MTPHRLARGYLYFMATVQAVIGLTALVMPVFVIRQASLAPTTVTGTAEARAIYGGGILAWSLITLGALHGKRLAPGLLAAMGIIMGLLATCRVFSLFVDGAPGLNLPAGLAEALIVAACVVVYRTEHRGAITPR